MLPFRQTSEIIKLVYLKGDMVLFFKELNEAAIVESMSSRTRQNGASENDNEGEEIFPLLQTC